jgi:hypothetical protein
MTTIASSSGIAAGGASLLDRAKSIRKLSPEEQAQIEALLAGASKNSPGSAATPAPAVSAVSSQAALDAGAKTRTDTQILGQQDIADRQRAQSEAAIKRFMDYQSKSTEEKMRDQILASMGLTEDDLKNMSPEEREKVEAKIAQIIKEKMEEQREKEAAKSSAGAQGLQAKPASPVGAPDSSAERDAVAGPRADKKDIHGNGRGANASDRLLVLGSLVASNQDKSVRQQAGTQSEADRKTQERA